MEKDMYPITSEMEEIELAIFRERTLTEEEITRNNDLEVLRSKDDR